MKILATVLSLCLIVLFISCQESLINQPETSLNTELNKTSQQEASNQEVNIYDVNRITKGEIIISHGVIDPLTGDCNIKGKVTYRREILDHTADAVKIKLNLEMDAEFYTNMMNPIKYKIYGRSLDIVLVSENGKIQLDKTYGITFRPDLRLCVRYVVTTNEVGISEVNLLQKVN
jgi:hypothetical protein